MFLKFKKLAVGVVFILIGMFFLVPSIGYGINSLSDIGAGFMPSVVSLTLIILGIIVLIDQWRT